MLWETYRKHFGPDGDPAILVAQGAALDFNPSLPKRAWLNGRLERDAASASAEYLAQFRTDLEAFVSLEAVHACIKPNVRERPPLPYVDYKAFVDPSGGRATALTLGIGHYEFARDTVVLDCLREFKPPFSPEAVVAELRRCSKPTTSVRCKATATAASGRSNSFPSSASATSHPPSPSLSFMSICCRW